MTVEMTFKAATPRELNELIHNYVDDSEGSAGVSATLEPNQASGGAVTNDDYRRAIRAIPKGKVAPYSVVSEVVRGDSHGSQKVAGLAANDPTLGTAYRVVRMDGSIAAGFRWTDGRMGGADEGRRVLEEEGVSFDVHGRVEPEHMLSADELRRFYEDQ